MAKRSASDINGWVFICIGFVVIAVSIFFYDTLKFFIIIGGIMTIYGLGKLSYDKVKTQLMPKEEEWPMDLNKTPNPYIQDQQKQQQNMQRHSQQQRQMTQTVMQGRYCGSCGSSVAVHHRYCTQCGNKVL